jgi:hypothetical protein
LDIEGYFQNGEDMDLEMEKDMEMGMDGDMEK